MLIKSNFMFHISQVQNKLLLKLLKKGKWLELSNLKVTHKTPVMRERELNLFPLCRTVTLEVSGGSKECFYRHFEVFKLEITISLNTISIGFKFSFYNCDWLFRVILIKETTSSLKKKKN